MMLLFAAALPLHAAGVMGDWSTPTKAVVRIYECGSTVCLKIVKLAPNGPEKLDAQNPKAGDRQRPLCGLTIGSGFHQVDPNHLDAGHLYDPKSGHTYSGTIVANGDELNLRGYIGISLFGRTEVWHRTSKVDAASCS